MMFWRNQTKLASLDLIGIADLIKEGKVKNIIILAGAGLSTAAGIPDFRSPSSGIYDNLEGFGLPYPQAVFESDFFRENPAPFFEVCRRIYRPESKPTLAHYFIKLLNDKGLLRRHYTQNVDSLERLSGLPEDKLIEAHGTFNTGHCVKCSRPYNFEYMRDQILQKRIPKCSSCQDVVKPDVVLFGDNLPARFYSNLSSDFSACDLLIVMGTSLRVLPFCALIHRVGPSVPRLYLNREYTEDDASGFLSFVLRFVVSGFRRRPLRWGKSGNTRDVFVQGDVDDSILRLADLLGWKDELLELKKVSDARLSQTVQSSTPNEVDCANIPRS